MFLKAVFFISSQRSLCGEWLSTRAQNEIVFDRGERLFGVLVVKGGPAYRCTRDSWKCFPRVWTVGTQVLLRKLWVAYCCTSAQRRRLVIRSRSGLLLLVLFVCTRCQPHVELTFIRDFNNLSFTETISKIRLLSHEHPAFSREALLSCQLEASLVSWAQEQLFIRSPGLAFLPLLKTRQYSNLPLILRSTLL